MVSLKNIKLIIITPTVPMAVQHAYAVPIGIVLNDNDKKIRLKIMNITVKIKNNTFVKFSENFNAKTHIISKIPAIIKYIHESIIIIL